MDELALIRQIRRTGPMRRDVRIGIGDDAAVVRPPRGRELVLKTDMVLEGVHFTRADSTPWQWGWKVAMCNLSDIAAMGAEPHWAMVAAGLPASTSLKEAVQIQKGVRDACRRFGVCVVGGDTCRSEERTVISVALVGSVRPGRAVTRAGARDGDFVFVTGRLGGSLLSGRHLLFTARMAESRFLTQNYRIHAMMDTSDGLGKDLRHIAEESRVGLRIFEALIPLNRGVVSPLSAFMDGEDFELLFTVSPHEADRLLKDPRLKLRKFNFYPIGRVVRRALGLKRVDPDGRLRAFPNLYDHHFGGWRSAGGVLEGAR